MRYGHAEVKEEVVLLVALLKARKKLEASVREGGEEVKAISDA